MKGWMTSSLCIVLGCAGVFLFSLPWLKKNEQLSKAVHEVLDPCTLLPVEKTSAVALKYFGDILNHPWIAMQTEVKEISMEMIRDLSLLKEVSSFVMEQAENEGKEVPSEEVIVSVLIPMLQELQVALPLDVPKNYYSVLCIPEMLQKEEAPYPYYVYKRIYLDENDLGLPFYLDVRVFDHTQEDDLERILDWHCSYYDETQTVFQSTGSEKAVTFLGHGYPKKNLRSLSQGFTSMQKDRGIFICATAKEDHIYVAFAEAPWSTFEKHLPFFEKVLSTQEICLDVLSFTDL